MSALVDHLTDWLCSDAFESIGFRIGFPLMASMPVALGYALLHAH